MRRKLLALLLGLLVSVSIVFALAEPAASPNNQAFTFLVFGDNQDGAAIFDHLLKQMSTEPKVSFAVSVGDCVDRGTESEYLAYRQKIAPLKFKVYQTPGNHDLVESGASYFQKYFGQLYYSFDYRNAHFVVLNNAFKESFTKEQFNWLKTDLAASQKKKIFVFMHRPTFDPTELYQDYVMSGRQVTTEMQELFVRYKVAYVISGHIHGYARSERNGVVYLISGGAGGILHLPPGFGGWHHYVRITVARNKVTDELVELKGD